jgi:glycosyltransferase involved in cell wall biosynthesis
MSAHPRNAGPPLVVGVILVEDVAGRGAGALAPLLARVAHAAAADVVIVLVDPRQPPGRKDVLAEALLRVGCTPSAGFEAAASAGAVALVEHAGARLAVAADAALAAPERRTVVDLLDGYALATAERSGAALRADGLWVLPAAALTAVAGGGDERPWARRLAAAQVPVAELAVVRRLRDRGVDPGVLAAPALARLAAPDAGAGVGAGRVRPAFAFDRVELPGRLEHGRRATIRVSGWMVGPDNEKGVSLWVGDRRILSGETTVLRPDVLAAFPGLEREDCGFELAGEVGPLAPGSYPVQWRGEPRGCRKRLGRLRVEPVQRLEVTRVFLPRLVPRGAPAPIAVAGRVVSSAASASVEARAGGRALEVSVVATPSDDPRLPGRFEFTARGRVEPGRLGRTTRGRLEVRSHDPLGERAWDSPVRFRGADVAVASALEEPWVGAFDPGPRTAPVALRGIVWDARPGDRVELEVDGRAAAAAPVAGGDPAAEEAGAFDLEAAVAGLEPGERRLELVLARAGGARETIRRWTQRVVAVPVTVRDVRVAVTPALAPEGDSRLVLEGSLEPGAAVDSLALAIDGRVRARLGAEWLHAAAAAEGAAAGFHRFRIDLRAALEPGTRSLTLSARRGSSEAEIWRGGIEAPERPEMETARLLSDELDRRVRDSPTPAWSRLELTGEVAGGRTGDAVELELAPGPAASAPVDAGGKFAVVARGLGDGDHRGRLLVRRDGAVAASSPEFLVRSRRIEAPSDTVAGLERLLSDLVPGRARFEGFGAAQALGELFAWRPGAIGDLRRAIEVLDRRRREAARSPGEVVTDPPERGGGGERMRILFGAWEPPCSLHGGGVAITNLLRGLDGRHDVTLVHTCAPGEEGLSEEVRPLVRELLAVRREWHAQAPPLAFDVPRHIARSYSPRYGETLEAELASGGYELFNGEYPNTLQHLDAADRPSLGVSYEVESFARAATAPAAFPGPEDAAAWLWVALRELHFETVFAPARVGELATVTAPEAEFLARWIPGRRIFVNPVPVDTRRFESVAAGRAPSEPPLFLFVGNFVHPPNRDAARLLAERIAPEVRRTLSDATFALAGPAPPEELRELDGRDGVRVTGFVPDLTELLTRATAFVAPIFSGAGMRVKILEAMAAGLPVVSTPLGLSGIGGRQGESWIEAGSVAEIAAAAVELAGDRERVGRIGSAGRRWVEAAFGIAAQAARRERIWRAVLAASAQR